MVARIADEWRALGALGALAADIGHSPLFVVTRSATAASPYTVTTIHTMRQRRLRAVAMVSGPVTR